ncbi:hypothetical protein [Candidatus Bandiella numerosa]
MYHFKNFSTYSLLTNLFAIPIAEFIIKGRCINAKQGRYAIGSINIR